MVMQIGKNVTQQNISEVIYFYYQTTQLMLLSTGNVVRDHAWGVAQVTYIGGCVHQIWANQSITPFQCSI